MARHWKPQRTEFPRRLATGKARSFRLYENASNRNWLNTVLEKSRVNGMDDMETQGAIPTSRAGFCFRGQIGGCQRTHFDIQGRHVGSVGNPSKSAGVLGDPKAKAHSPAWGTGFDPLLSGPIPTRGWKPITQTCAGLLAEATSRPALSCGTKICRTGRADAEFVPRETSGRSGMKDHLIT